MGPMRRVSEETKKAIVKAWKTNLDAATGKSLSLKVLAERFRVSDKVVTDALVSAGVYVPGKGANISVPTQPQIE